MPGPQRTKLSSGVPDLLWMVTDDGSLTLWNEQYDESYHSGCGALAESLVVYLIHSGVAARLANHQTDQVTRVFELGFGTGTAFLLTAALAESLAKPIEYWSIENRLLPASIVQRLDIAQHIDQVLHTNQQLAQQLSIDALHFSRLTYLTEQLAESLTNLDPNSQHHCVAIGDYCILHLLQADAATWDIQQDCAHSLGQFHAVYYDAFSPEASPELWTSELFSRMFQLLAANGTLTSYCVKSSVRKTLQQAGFSITRLPGPIGGKREVLVARKP